MNSKVNPIETPTGVYCHNNPTSRELIKQLGLIAQDGGYNYLRFNFSLGVAIGSNHIAGILLYPEDLEILLLMPTKDSQYFYINQLKEERLSTFTKEQLWTMTDLLKW